MPKIELNAYDLCIKRLPDGATICQIQSRLAFDEAFIEQMKEAGVKEFKPREE